MAKLVCIYGNNQGEEYPVEEGVTGIGRSTVCSVFLRDAKCSRMHCNIHKKGRQYQVEDMGSANGTQVDGKAVKHGEFMTIRYGATLYVGASRLLFCDGECGATTASGLKSSVSGAVANMDKTVNLVEDPAAGHSSGVDLSRASSAVSMKRALIREQELKIMADPSPIMRAIRMAIFRVRCAVMGAPTHPQRNGMNPKATGGGKYQG